MNKKVMISAAIIAVIVIVIQFITNIFLDYQWFFSYGHSQAFWTLFFTEFNIHVVFTMLFFALFSLNFLLIRLLGGKGKFFANNILDRVSIPVLKSPKTMFILIIFAAALLLSWFMGSIASSFWKEILVFFNRTPFTNFKNDPVFSQNISFYIFSLPFYKFLYGWLLASVILLTLISVSFHIINGGISLKTGRISSSLFTRSHLSILFSILTIIYGVGYKLSAYSLLLKSRSKFFGAGFADVNSRILVYNICFILSMLAAAFFLVNIFKRSYKLILLIGAVLLPTYFILGTLIPNVQQRFFVIPNELDKERPFIQNNIDFTRMAYGLTNLKTQDFKNDADLNHLDIKENIDTLRNIRLWDWKPLKQTYKQLQELKPYYNFHDVDVDRYIIDDRKIAVNISARELDSSKISSQAQTWVNQHMIYTHGYGFVMSRVDKITPEGLPEMIVKNIPPTTKLDFEITRPEIYYGEHKNDYVFTNTDISPGEFNYPFGDKNNYSIYEGSGGIEVGTFFKRLLFAISFKDINILISENINSDSRILYRRNIKEMVETLTPYLIFDDDPYVVLSKGKLFWIIDGYTYSDKFPYSTPMPFKNRRINYIRNSVKVVIDAYNGSMNYYVTDDEDPVLKTYAKIFPTIFKPFSKMDDDLKSHLRYPEKLFDMQRNILLKYHMTDVNVFYNNEDLWNIPNHIYEDKTEVMPSTYLVTKLPEQDKASFILMIPFTPSNKDNMLGFMVANCDKENYGELTLYRLPKESLTYGPMQIEARINQDADISKQLTLWSQKGSKVIRGNMIVLPIKSSLLFIEPLYLKADTSEMPELKRVILNFSDKIYMAENLDAALEMMFFENATDTSEDEDIEGISDKAAKESSEPLDDNMKQLISEAYSSYMKAENFVKNGDWENYGKEMSKLKDILRKLNQ